MADITLSKAVRSNLLNLQSTATQLGKTQERLATGLKVNSALDNPTNFFTASSLNSRAGDLGNLLDSISNATQTIEAADNGISAITKLVESAQAAARQAKQVSATVTTTTAADAGTVAGGAFTTVDVSGTGASATSATVTGSGFAAVDLSAATTTASVVGGAFSAVDFTNSGGNDGDISFNLNIDGAGVQAISVDYADVNGTVSNNAAVTANELVGILNDKINTAFGTTGQTYASVNGSGGIDISSTTAGGSGSVAISGFSATNGATGSGLADGTDTGVTGDSISFSLTVGSTTQSITLDSTITASNSAAVTADEIATAINTQFGSNVVDGSSGELVISDSATGASSVVTIGSITTTGNGTTLGLTAGTTNGQDAGSGDAISFSLTVDSGTAQTITIDAAAVTAYNSANSTSFDSSALTAANIAALINDQATGATATVNATSGGIDIASDTTGTTSDVTIASYASTATSGATGIANGTDTGSAATTTSGANPARDTFVAQYNDLLSQIDDLVTDASFNGVNLLNGDTLQVQFNEDGSSNLDITGVTFDSSGLGLSTVASGGFDTNAAIDTVLNTLGGAIDDLRSQASTFGSNLSVVETRKDFTNAMINTLETGAANLTLADTNEEAANLLALQTRQQLSSTALSLASQSDQNVLRLF